MDLDAQLNPSPWRDDDAMIRIVAPSPRDGLDAVLQSHFRLEPMPSDLQDLLDRIR